jgi:membrane protease YdiL (CAAX protease family)
MKNAAKVLIGYIIFIFILQSLAVFFSTFWSMIYLQFAIFAMGIGAIICQKIFHRGKFIDMGFRLNRNASIGLGIGLLFTAIVLIFVFWLPLQLGFVEITINENSLVAGEDLPQRLAILILVVGGIIAGLIACLFGEELAFRGYILPKLEQIFGPVKAVIFCAVLFGLWHLPAYFSIYAGGAAEEGWTSVAVMLFVHAISVIPLCILYLTTRELYGVSLYHTLVNIFQYSIVANPAFGELSKNAIYNMKVNNELAMAIIGWVWQVLGIFIMLGLYRLAKTVVVHRNIPDTSTNGDIGENL